MEMSKFYIELQLLKGQIDSLCKVFEKEYNATNNLSQKKKEQLKRNFNIEKHISKSVVKRNLRNKKSDE